MNPVSMIGCLKAEPILHPFVGMLFEPMEVAPIVGASVFIDEMPKATARSEGKAILAKLPVLIGGAPIISMTLIGMKLAMGALGKAAGMLKIKEAPCPPNFI